MVKKSDPELRLRFILTLSCGCGCGLSCGLSCGLFINRSSVPPNYQFLMYNKLKKEIYFPTVLYIIFRFRFNFFGN